MADTGRSRPARTQRADARRNRVRVLEAAETVFAANGVAASMEEIARHAGVGVGTIYRHFPTKEVLIEAILVVRYERLSAEAETLSSTEDAGAAFFTLFRRMVEEAATKQPFADALTGSGIDVKAAISDSGHRLIGAFEIMFDRAQSAGAVRRDTDITEVMAILSGMCLGAEYATWDSHLQERALQLVFDGLGATSPTRSTKRSNSETEPEPKAER